MTNAAWCLTIPGLLSGPADPARQDVAATDHLAGRAAEPNPSRWIVQRQGSSGRGIQMSTELDVTWRCQYCQESTRTTMGGA